MKYYISLFVPGKKNSGAYGKARQDVDVVLSKRGYKPIYVTFSMIQNQLARKFGVAFLLEYVQDLFSWIRIFITVKKNSVLVYQHPMQSSIVVYYFLRILKKVKKTRIIAIIHDLYTLRDGKKNDTWYRNIKDIGILNEAAVVICHNSKMKDYLFSKGVCNPQIIKLGIFDYIYSGHLKKKIPVNNSKMRICIAGNLSKSKSGYIYKLGELAKPVVFELYGNGYENTHSCDNCIYKGSFPADKLPEQLDQNFGLVWDGDNLNECAGNVGRYTMYNNPHKVSLYLMTGLPIIIWKKAALAKFIEDMGVGIAVESLKDIPEEINSLSLEDYTAMRERTDRLSEMIRRGEFMNNALALAEDKVENMND